MEVLKSNFNKRGYPEKILQQQIIKAKTTDRKELLKEKEKNSSQRVHFTTTFNKNLPIINSVFGQTLASATNKFQNRVIFYGETQTNLSPQ